MAAFTYPSWFEPHDRTRIDAAVQAAEAALVPPVRHLRMKLPTSAAVIQHAVDVCAVVARVLEDHHHRQPDDRRLRTAERLRTRIIAWAFEKQASSLLPQSRQARRDSLDREAFISAVLAALETQPWWRPFLPTSSGNVAPAAVRKPRQQRLEQPTLISDQSPLMSLKRATRLLGDLHEDTLKRWHEDGTANLRKVGGRWKISQAEVDRLKTTPKIRSRIR
jgi:hypothetical protein